jgi:hypothetical protein
MDYLCLIPNEVLKNNIFLPLDLKDCFTLRLVCKRFHLLLGKDDNNDIWKAKCLEFYKDYRDNHIEGRTKVSFHPETIQLITKKPWFWFCRSFLNNKIYTTYTDVFMGNDRDGISVFGSAIDTGTSFENEILQGFGTRFSTTEHTVYQGNFINGNYSGHGVLRTKHGSIYSGKWKYNALHGYGTITYPDGYKCEATWSIGVPNKDIGHPKVQECARNKICTNTLPVMPQKTADYLRFCEPCWIYCLNGPSEELDFDLYFKGCRCTKCKY